MRRLLRVDRLIIHCSATRPSMDIGDDEIKQWHLAKDPPWDDIGYHIIIRRSGVVEFGRSFDEQGAHVRGHNTDSLGLCLIGGVSEGDVNVAEANYTPEQWGALGKTVDWIKVMLSHASVLGHCDLDANKACPSFDVGGWLARR